VPDLDDRHAGRVRRLDYERNTGGGSYLAWLVVDGDPRDLPNFWPV